MSTGRPRGRPPKHRAATTDPVVAASVLAGLPAVEEIARNPMKPGLQVKDMTHDQLRVYATGLGITQRDVDNLTCERLRQNVLLHVYGMFDED